MEPIFTPQRQAPVPSGRLLCPAAGSCALTCDLARTGRCRCPILGAAAHRPGEPLRSYSQLGGRSTASVIEPSTPEVSRPRKWCMGPVLMCLLAEIRRRREARRPPRDPSKWLAGTKQSEAASSMTPARATWRLGLRLVYGFSHGPVLSVRRRDGVKAPPGALTPRRGRCVKRAWVTWGAGAAGDVIRDAAWVKTRLRRSSSA